MDPEHYEELIRIGREPVGKLTYALGMLSDVVDANMVGSERDNHVQDAKEIIILACKEAGMLK